MKTDSSQRGFMQIVILAVVIISALAYFNIDLRAIFDKPGVQTFVGIVGTVWATYIKPIGVFIWSHLSGLLQ